MKVLVAIDSFKGCMSSIEAGKAAAKGIKKAKPESEIIVKSLADGGEGTIKALLDELDGILVKLPVKDPLGKDIIASYGIINDTAVIEMAEASGLTLIKSDQLNPWKANTFGTGQLIKDALDRGIRDFIIGIGGSATTEAGIGLLNCLGIEFYDKDNNLLPPVLESFKKLDKISTDNLLDELNECNFRIACDVTNPLYGKTGAVQVFGPQKGVKSEEIQKIDQLLFKFSEITKKATGNNYGLTQGSGAAGGLGFAFLSYFPNSKLESGFKIISEFINLKTDLTDCDIVLTGEGRLDSQTAMGKVPVSLAKFAKELGVKTVIAVAGSISSSASQLNKEGINAFFSILKEPSSLEEAMNKETALRNLELTVEQIFRLI